MKNEKKLKTIEIDFEEEYLDQILGSYAEIKNLDSKIYVKKQSEHIFEPKQGDMGIESNNLVKIIMRNGKQFFMPEQEIIDNKN